MFLLEHDAKTLLAGAGVPVPPGVLVERADTLPAKLPPAPWVVKAQVPVGGRGKAGLIRRAQSPAELQAACGEILGRTHRGHTVHSVRVESALEGAAETYVSLALEPSAGALRIMVAPQGGVEIETLAAADTKAVRTATVDLDAAAVQAAVPKLTAGCGAPLERALADALSRLARVFLDGELRLLEINPLFVRPDGTWFAGDAKIVTDDDAVYRQPAQAELLAARGPAYPEAHRKRTYGCDFVVVDPEGELGLLTTGAGLSMMLIDELRAEGLKPYNFLDVRTGGLRGDPTRLVHVLEWLAQAPKLRAVLVNIFAGITDLGEFSRLLVEAFARVPQLKVPVVARLVGNNLETARGYLAERGIAVEPDLDAALALVRGHLQRMPAP
jgi:succinyl-CoA synthetase beta subunit